MAALFSLGTAQEEDHHSHNNQEDNSATTTTNNNNSNNNRNGVVAAAVSSLAPNGFFLFGNEEIYNTANKSLELWQQQQQQQQQQSFRQRAAAQTSSPQGMNLSYFSAGRLGMDLRTATTFNVFDEPSSTRSGSGGAGLMMSRQGVGGGGVGVGGINCQDCGNQAKKDCTHQRCRTCCKSRGYHCATHVKSTWVPAAKRRERQQQLTTMQQQQQQQSQQLIRPGTGRESTPKRPRENPGNSNSALSITRIPTTSGLEVGHFPAEVNSPAVFRCVRLNSIDDEDEQFAYQTAVSIGGHVFKGILYDHGSESGYGAAGGEASSVGGGGVITQQFNLMAAAAAANDATVPGAADAAASSNNNPEMVDPSLYPAPLNAFMAGTQFFPHPRS